MHRLRQQGGCHLLCQMTMWDYDWVLWRRWLMRVRELSEILMLRRNLIQTKKSCQPLPACLPSRSLEIFMTRAQIAAAWSAS